MKNNADRNGVNSKVIWQFSVDISLVISWRKEIWTASCYRWDDTREVICPWSHHRQWLSQEQSYESLRSYLASFGWFSSAPPFFTTVYSSLQLCLLIWVYYLTFSSSASHFFILFTVLKQFKQYITRAILLPFKLRFMMFLSTWHC